MTIEKLRKEHGGITVHGKNYVLVENAYIDGPVCAPIYKAMAICPEDKPDELGCMQIYDIEWEPKAEWLASDSEDEGWACDWDNPSDVSESKGYVYDLDENRVI